MGNFFGGQTGSGTQTTKSTTAPWAPFQPFLVGGPNTTGLWPEANGIYNTYRNPGGSAPSGALWNDTNNRLINTNLWYSNNPAFGRSNNNAEAIINGQWNPTITPAAAVTPQNVNPASARASQGVLDPTNSLSAFLNGTASNPYVDANARAVTDLATRNLERNILPNIASGAEAAGQYGSSRQGIAEANAISDMNTNLAPALTGMYSNATESALGRQFATAQGLNDQATNIATGNANRDLLGSEFNSDLTLKNNAQGMQNSALQVANAGAGLGLLGQTGNTLNSFLSGGQNAITNPGNYAWGNLNNYANLIYPGMKAGQESTSTTTQPVFGSPFGQILGGALGLGSLATPGAGGTSALGNIFGGLGSLFGSAGGAPFTGASDPYTAAGAFMLA